MATLAVQLRLWPTCNRQGLLLRISLRSPFCCRLCPLQRQCQQRHRLTPSQKALYRRWALQPLCVAGIQKLDLDVLVLNQLTAHPAQHAICLRACMYESWLKPGISLGAATCEHNGQAACVALSDDGVSVHLAHCRMLPSS